MAKYDLGGGFTAETDNSRASSEFMQGFMKAQREQEKEERELLRYLREHPNYKFKVIQIHNGWVRGKDRETGLLRSGDEKDVDFGIATIVPVYSLFFDRRANLGDYIAIFEDYGDKKLWVFKILKKEEPILGNYPMFTCRWVLEEDLYEHSKNYQEVR